MVRAGNVLVKKSGLGPNAVSKQKKNNNNDNVRKVKKIQILGDERVGSSCIIKKKNKFSKYDGIAEKKDLFDDLIDEDVTVETEFGEIVYFKSSAGATVYNKNVSYNPAFFWPERMTLSNAKLFPRDRKRFVREESPYVWFSFKTSYSVEAYEPIKFQHAHNRPVGCAEYVIKNMSGKEYSALDLKTRLNLVDVLENCAPGFHVWLRTGLTSYIAYTTTADQNVNKESIKCSKVLVIENHSNGLSHVWLGNKPLDPFVVQKFDTENNVVKIINLEPGVDINRVSDAARSQHQFATNNGFFGCNSLEWVTICAEITMARDRLARNSNIEDLLNDLHFCPVLCAKYGIHLNRNWGRLFFGFNPFPQFADNIQARMILYKRLTSDFPSPFGYVPSWTDPNASEEFNLPAASMVPASTVNGVWRGPNNQIRVRTFLAFDFSRYYNDTFTEADCDDLIEECKALWASIGFTNSQHEIILNPEHRFFASAFHWLNRVQHWDWSVNREWRWHLPQRTACMSPSSINSPLIHRGCNSHDYCTFRQPSGIFTIIGEPGRILAGEYEEPSDWRIGGGSVTVEDMTRPILAIGPDEPASTLALLSARNDIVREVVAMGREVPGPAVLEFVEDVEGLAAIDEVANQMDFVNNPAADPSWRPVRINPPIAAQGQPRAEEPPPVPPRIRNPLPSETRPNAADRRAERTAERTERGEEVTWADQGYFIWDAIKEEMMDGVSIEVERFNEFKEEIKRKCVEYLGKAETFVKANSQQIGIKGKICMFLRKSFKLLKNIISGSICSVEAIYSFFALIVRVFSSRSEDEVPQMNRCDHCAKEGRTFFSATVCDECLVKPKPITHDFACPQCGAEADAWFGEDLCINCVPVGKYATIMTRMPWCPYSVSIYMTMRNRWEGHLAPEVAAIAFSAANPVGVMMPQRILDVAILNSAPPSHPPPPPPVDEEAMADEELVVLPELPPLPPVPRQPPNRPLPSIPVSSSSLPPPDLSAFPVTNVVNDRLPEIDEVNEKHERTEETEDVSGLDWLSNNSEAENADLNLAIAIQAEELQEERNITFIFDNQPPENNNDSDFVDRNLTWSVEETEENTVEPIEVLFPPVSNDIEDMTSSIDEAKRLREMRLLHLESQTKQPEVPSMTEEEFAEFAEGLIRKKEPDTTPAIVMPVFPMRGPPTAPFPRAVEIDMPEAAEIEIRLPVPAEEPVGRWRIPHGGVNITRTSPPVGPPPPGQYTSAVAPNGYMGWARQSWDYGSSQIGDSTFAKTALWIVKEFLTDFDAGFYDAFKLGKHSMYWCFKMGNKYSVNFGRVDRRPVQWQNVNLRCRNPRFECVELVSAVGNHLNRGSVVNLRDLEYRRLIVCKELMEAYSAHIKLNNVQSSADVEWIKSIEMSNVWTTINLTMEEVIETRQFFIAHSFWTLGRSAVNRLANTNQPAH